MTDPTLPPAPAAPAPQRLRVLYAEDMAQLRELIVIVLERDGHTVDTVANGALALEKFLAHPGQYDVVITDHHMPGMNGLELTSALRALPYRGHMIVFSSELSEAVDLAYRRLKVDYILPKPIFPAQLRELFATLGKAPAAAAPRITASSR